MREPVSQYEPLPAPPRILFWSLIIIFVLTLVGGASGVIIFRNVLRPGQQQRVINMLPFMSVFLSKQDPNATLPTVVPPADSNISPDDLLNSPLLLPATDEVEAEAVETEESTPEAVSVVPTATPIPPTATPPPTIAPTIPPTAVEAAAVGEPAPEEPAESVAAAPAVSDLTGATVALAADETRPRAPSSARLYGFTHTRQTWNNCGPANITMALSYFGWREGQEVAASYLKPDREDKNVSPWELVSFVNENSGVRAATRLGGDMDLLKLLIANNYPAIIETGYAPEGYDWIGHYRTVVGYDDGLRQFYVYDSYLGSGEAGEGLAVDYTEFDRDWQAFNRVFLVFYEQQNEAQVVGLLGNLADPMMAAEHALTVAQQEARANPQNVFAWFNMGTALTRLERYEEAAAAYDRANQIGLHFRMAWYQFGQFEAYFNVGRYNDVLSIVNYNLNNGGQYVEETHYWQARVLEAQGNRSEAASAYNRALAHNPRYDEAQRALDALNRS
jgi:hypothetical protein